MKLDDVCQSTIAIIVREEVNGYSIQVAQFDDYECSVSTPMPKEGFVIPHYQMTNFMTCLIIDCQKAYETQTSVSKTIEEKRKDALERIKQGK